MLSPLIELTPAHFPLITESTSVVDFFAPWCPPCMMLLPELRRAAREMPNVIFGSVDCAAHAQLCQQVGSFVLCTPSLHDIGVTYMLSEFHFKENSP